MKDILIFLLSCNCLNCVHFADLCLISFWSTWRYFFFNFRRHQYGYFHYLPSFPIYLRLQTFFFFSSRIYSAESNWPIITYLQTSVNSASALNHKLKKNRSFVLLIPWLSSLFSRKAIKFTTDSILQEQVLSNSHPEVINFILIFKKKSFVFITGSFYSLYVRMSILILIFMLKETVYGLHIVHLINLLLKFIFQTRVMLLVPRT